MAERFCPLPWLSLALRNNGQYRVCCPANQAEGKGLLQQPSGETLTASGARIVDARNAPLMKAVRRSLLQGEWHPACKRCQIEEQSGLPSRRQVEEPLWREHLTRDQALRATAADGTLTDSAAPIRHLDLRLGNSCNLKCRTCNPTESSLWAEDHLSLWGDSYNEATEKIYLRREASGRLEPVPNPYAWHESDNFWRELEPRLRDLRTVHFSGGEPLLIPRHYEFLEACVNQGAAENIVLEYNTNLTVLPARALKLWTHFRRVQLGVSVDGVGQVNDYIRSPSRWSGIEKNLATLDQAPGRFVIWFATTVLAYNILSLPELMEWRIRQRFQRIHRDHNLPLLCPHPLHRPQFLSIQMFSPQEKIAIAQRLRAKLPRVIAAIRESWSAENVEFRAAGENQAQTIIENYIQFMGLQDLSHLRGKFQMFTHKLDQIRGESMAESLPELSSMIEWDPAISR